tara:strand:- start:1658 stop:1780 length:123 start_codon:yes stop_codon:yes gene_type:complete
MLIGKYSLLLGLAWINAGEMIDSEIRNAVNISNINIKIYL